MPTGTRDRVGYYHYQTRVNYVSRNCNRPTLRQNLAKTMSLAMQSKTMNNTYWIRVHGKNDLVKLADFQVNLIKNLKL